MAGYAIADVRVTDEALFAEFAAGSPQASSRTAAATSSAAGTSR